MFLMTLGNIGDLWDAIHDTDLVVIGRPLFSILFLNLKGTIKSQFIVL
jgi:hypothetical protein